MRPHIIITSMAGSKNLAHKKKKKERKKEKEKEKENAELIARRLETRKKNKHFF